MPETKSSPTVAIVPADLYALEISVAEPLIHLAPPQIEGRRGREMIVHYVMDFSEWKACDIAEIVPIKEMPSDACSFERAINAPGDRPDKRSRQIRQVVENRRFQFGCQILS